MSRKQLIYLFIAAVGFLLLFVIFLAFQQSSTPTTAKIQGGVTPVPTQVSKLMKTADGGYRPFYPTPTASPQINMTPAQTAVAFYNSFATVNPMANGAYKNNPYLTGDFKALIGESYNNGNRPVFCQRNRRPSVTAGREIKKYYDQGYMTQEVLVDPASNKELYIVTLLPDGNTWHVDDVSCLP